MPPGASIQKDRLTEEFYVSRAPVNDALARLRSDGLVRIAPQHGTFVSEISLAEVKEGQFIRRSLEREAIGRLAQIIDDETVGLLDELLSKQAHALKSDNAGRRYELDAEFHTLLLHSQGFKNTAKLISTFNAHLIRAARQSYQSVTSARESLRGHREIVEALRQRDPNWAASAMDCHLAGAEIAMSRLATVD